MAALETEHDQIKDELELAWLDVEQLKTDRVDELLSQKDQNVDDLRCQVNELKRRHKSLEMPFTRLKTNWVTIVWPNWRVRKKHSGSI